MLILMLIQVGSSNGIIEWTLTFLIYFKLLALVATQIKDARSSSRASFKLQFLMMTKTYAQNRCGAFQCHKGLKRIFKFAVKDAD